jgi:UDP-N-acetylglucosamine acyltransferase
MANIHPMAIVDASAVVHDDATVGPFCVVERDVTIGAGTVLREHVVVRKHTTLGAGNQVDPFVCLGGEPQDLKFDPDTVSYLRIGDNNVFREGVTISRATTPGGATTIGSNTLWMHNTHTGHDTIIGDGCIIVGGTMIAGHSELGKNVILSGAVLVHQFTRIGDRVMSQGRVGIGQHVPPYCMLSDINNVVGLNAVGLRRAPEISDEDRKQIKEAYRITYREGLTPTKALEAMDACSGWGTGATKFREFVRMAITAEKPYARGLCPQRGREASRKS